MNKKAFILCLAAQMAMLAILYGLLEKECKKELSIDDGVDFVICEPTGKYQTMHDGSQSQLHTCK